MKTFTKKELAEIVKHSINLSKYGYFTGINFIQSDLLLPKESIIVHFLHNSKKYAERLSISLKSKSIILPRDTFYFLDPKYFDKPTFNKDYKESTFLDENFSEITIDLAKQKRTGISVKNKELDLLVPLEVSSLEETVNLLKEIDKDDPERWVDPVIIVRTKDKMKTIPGFVNAKNYVSLERDNAEIYTIVPDNKRSKALNKYYRGLCKDKPNIGELNENSLVFNIS